MRKFRGKTESDEWVEGDFYTDQIELQSLSGATYLDKSIIRDDLHQDHYVLESTVGQSTGLKDKNGKEIFEGDVLEYINGEGDIFNGTVIYKDGGWYLTGGFQEWLCEGYYNEMEIIENVL